MDKTAFLISFFSVRSEVTFVLLLHSSLCILDKQPFWLVVSSVMLKVIFVSPLRSSGDIEGSLLCRLSVCHKTCPSQNLSGLLLINYWCNFIQTLQELSVPSLVVHIVSIFRFNDFCQSYGPVIIFNFKVCPDYFSYTTNAISMKLYRIDL
jgi:hypothetical protein